MAARRVHWLKLGRRPRQEPDGRHLHAEAQRALSAFAIDGQMAKTIFFNRNAGFVDRLGAAFRLLVGFNREPAMTTRCQGVALTWLLKSGGQLTFDAMLPPIARHFASMWRQHGSTPALLKSPRIVLPLLHDAIESATNAPEQLLAVQRRRSRHGHCGRARASRRAAQIDESACSASSMVTALSALRPPLACLSRPPLTDSALSGTCVGKVSLEATGGSIPLPCGVARCSYCGEALRRSDDLSFRRTLLFGAQKPFYTLPAGIVRL